MKAIQCKYHEASIAFMPSNIFEPLLQMMYHYQNNQTADIQYILYAHYPSITNGSRPSISKENLQAAINSENSAYKKLTSELKNKIDLDQFLTKFTMDFGLAFDDLVAKVKSSFENAGLPVSEIDTLIYPNAINCVAEISTRHNPEDRKITKKSLLERLKAIRKTAISRWTLALKSRKQLLETRRKQLKVHLDKNSRLRYFIINAENFDDYQTEIVLFICDYIEKYHFKPAHINTPVICVSTTVEDFRDIQYRLHTKGIISTDGYIGEHFDETWFFREPISCKGSPSPSKREFALRLLTWREHGNILNNRKCDDLFLLGEFELGALNMMDVNVEQLAASTFKEIKFLIGVSDVYE